VKYRIEGEIEFTSHCHCTMCQKQHGAAFGSYGNVPLHNFSYRAGAELLAVFESSAGVRRTFCGRCGSSLTWHSERQFKDQLAVALGTLDTPYTGVVTRNIHTDTRAGWLAHA
jgi:hypothetical protein